MVVETTSSKASSASFGEKPAATSRSERAFDEGHVDEPVRGDRRGVDETRGLASARARSARANASSHSSHAARSGTAIRWSTDVPTSPRSSSRLDDVVVERGHRDAESLGDRRHGDLLGAGLGRELDRGAHDAVAVDASRASGPAPTPGSPTVPLLSTVMVP